MRTCIKTKQVSLLMKLIKDKYSKCKFIYSKHATNSGIKRMDLMEYLKYYNNYKRLDTFLSSCFAKENLDFISKCIVFHNVLLSRLSKIEMKQYRELQCKQNNEFLCKLYELKFDYLQDLTSDYSQKLEQNKLNQILNSIKTEYILESAISSINISWEVRTKLIDFFDNFDDDNKQNENNKYLCLSIMNEALSQVYEGLDALYINYYR